jgi:hypothetical protein
MELEDGPMLPMIAAVLVLNIAAVILLLAQGGLCGERRRGVRDVSGRGHAERNLPLDHPFDDFFEVVAGHASEQDLNARLQKLWRMVDPGGSGFADLDQLNVARRRVNPSQQGRLLNHGDLKDLMEVVEPGKVTRDAFEGMLRRRYQDYVRRRIAAAMRPPQSQDWEILGGMSALLHEVQTLVRTVERLQDQEATERESMRRSEQTELMVRKSLSLMEKRMNRSLQAVTAGVESLTAVTSSLESPTSLLSASSGRQSLATRHALPHAARASVYTVRDALRDSAFLTAPARSRRGLYMVQAHPRKLAASPRGTHEANVPNEPPGPTRGSRIDNASGLPAPPAGNVSTIPWPQMAPMRNR